MSQSVFSLPEIIQEWFYAAILTGDTGELWDEQTCKTQLALLMSCGRTLPSAGQLPHLQDIKDFLQRCGIRRDMDVSQLNLAKKNICCVPELLRFRFLRRLWLNNNKIRELSCRSLNCCLTELYLQNNNIKSVTGALSHLTCLRLLFLHNNQIRWLEDTVHELRRMQQLRNATFFLNPVSHEPGYRHYVIQSLPSIEVLDRKEVKPAERRRSLHMCNQDRYRVLQSVAFGRQKT